MREWFLGCCRSSGLIPNLRNNIVVSICERFRSLGGIVRSVPLSFMFSFGFQRLSIRLLNSWTYVYFELGWGTCMALSGIRREKKCAGLSILYPLAKPSRVQHVIRILTSK